MAYLVLEGVTIPVAGDSGTAMPVEMGGRVRAFDGTYLSHRRALKKKWNFETKRLTQDEASALRGLLLGLGDFWPYSADLFSSKGQAADAVADIRFRTEGADGARVSNDYKFDGAMFVEDALTNLSDLRDTDTTSDFTNYPLRAAGVTVVNDSGSFYVGSGCVFYAMGGPAGSPRWVEAFLGNKSGSTTWSASVYVKPDVASGVRGILKNITDAIDGSAVVVQCPANEWTRVEVFVTASDAGLKDFNFRLEEENANDLSTLRVDGFQLESRAWSGTYENTSTPVGASGTLRYPNPIGEDTGAVSINLWSKGPATNYPSGSKSYACIITDISDLANTACFQQTAGDLTLTTIGPSGTGGDNLNTPDPWDGAWHMITAVVNRNPPAGRFAKEIYIDGVLAASITPAAENIPADFTAPASIFVGNLDGTQMLNGGIEALTVVPYAMSASLIAGLFTATKTNVGRGRLRATGSFSERPEEIVDPELGRSKVMDFAEEDTGVWQDNGETVSFTLNRV